MEEKRTSKKIISMMSGTSCDSIDVGLCLVKPDYSCTLIDGYNYEYPNEIKDRIFNVFFNGANVDEICKLNFLIGECFADAANKMITLHGKPDFISSHGQTVYHYPQNTIFAGISEKSTLQIGEPSVIAQKTGCMTIANFRTADIAQGGNGAPLVCFADEKWFKPLNKNIAVQNIGGISNVTIISKNYATFGFDNGLGNIMIDYCAKKFFNKNYDKNGELALSGNVSENWLNCLLADEYYYAEPPKTTGREYFSDKYIENTLKSAPENKFDIMATVTALTAKTIAQSYERFVYPNTIIEEVIIGGGGAYNPAIKIFLQKYLGKNVIIKTHEDYGISNNYKEVMAFALLGYCTYYKIPNNVPNCTGSEKEVIMGQISYP
ncbi:anhydro-N-acetylmuramic acid kinase [bacterium]|nr:anhydro-N-acetylmuramic acid kinase [bacterium]